MSSEEREYYTMLQGGAATLFVKSLCSELRLNHGTPKIRHGNTQGSRGVKHLEIRML